MGSEAVRLGRWVWLANPSPSPNPNPNQVRLGRWAAGRAAWVRLRGLALLRDALDAIGLAQVFPSYHPPPRARRDRTRAGAP